MATNVGRCKRHAAEANGFPRVPQHGAPLARWTRCGPTTRQWCSSSVTNGLLPLRIDFSMNSHQPARVCWTMALASMLSRHTGRLCRIALSAGHRHAGSRPTEAHCSADAPSRTVADMQALLGSGERIYPHPATRLLVCRHPGSAVVGASRSGADDLSTIEWQGAGALLTRPHGAVLWSVCDEATVALVASVRRRRWHRGRD